MPVLAATGPTFLWYVGRGAGVASLVLLTTSVVVGVLTSQRWNTTRWPRFVVEFVHRNASLVALALLVVHIATVILDGFAPIGWKDAVLPFVSAYRPIWLGMGALAFDLLVALIVTSLLRHRIGYRTWRIVHWAAYACWPLALVHGFGTGTDTKVGVVLVISGLCAVAVLLSVWWRLLTGWQRRSVPRVAALTVSVLVPLAVVAWLEVGPLTRNWARDAGTPRRLLAPTAAAASSASPAPATSAPSTSASGNSAQFEARLSGSIQQSPPDARGLVTIHVRTTLAGGASGSLDVTLRGQPLEDGGVLLDDSDVTLADNVHGQYQGKVARLQGARMIADLHAVGTRDLSLSIDLQIDDQTSTVSGTVRTISGAPSANPDRERGRGGDD